MRFKSIDLLRGFAATIVVFYHMWSRFYPNASSRHGGFHIPPGVVGHSLFYLIGFGYLGVNLFFVISGFCIHLPQALKFRSSPTSRLNIRKFALRRFWRLYPAYFASLLWTSALLLLFPLILALARHSHLDFVHAADLSGLLTNALFLQQLRRSALAFNGVYWTLLYEVQFYLVYPALLRICRRIGFAWPLLFLLMCEVVLALKPLPIPDFFLARYFEWFLGMYLAERIAARSPINVSPLTFPILLAAAIGSVFVQTIAPFRDILASSAFAALLVICLRNESSRFLNQPRILAVGVFSYSLYLVHVPVIDLFWNGVRYSQAFVPAIPETAALLAVPAAFLIGYLSFHYFERPFLGEKKNAGNLPAGPKEQAW